MDGESNLEALRACTYALSAMVCALAATHPQPAQLRAAFEKEAEESMAIALGQSISDAELKWLQHYLQQMRQQMAGAG